MVRHSSLKVATSLIALSATAYAGNVSIAGNEAALGAEYRVNFAHNNNGLLKDEDNKPKATTDISAPWAALTLAGKLSDKISYDMNYMLSTVGSNGEAGGNGFNWFGVEYACNEMFKTRVAQDGPHMGGWEFINATYDAFAPSSYMSHLPMNGVMPHIEQFVTIGNFGTASLQFMNDVVAVDGSPGAEGLRFNTEQKRAISVFQYRGTFSGVTPLLQYAKYDNGKSSFMNFGVNVKVADLDAYVDYMSDSRALRSAVGSDESVDNKMSNIVLDLRYAYGKHNIFFKYSMFDVKQEEDVKGNAVAGSNDDFDDNGNSMALGVVCKEHDGFNPYASFEQRSAKFLKGADETESRSDMAFNFGVMGKF
jgi:hypothetical protein